MAKEDIAFPSLVTAHVASALYLDWWRIDPNLSYLESCWAGSGHSPYRRMGALGITYCTQGNFQPVLHFHIGFMSQLLHVFSFHKIKKRSFGHAYCSH